MEVIIDRKSALTLPNVTAEQALKIANASALANARAIHAIDEANLDGLDTVKRVAVTHFDDLEWVLGDDYIPGEQRPEGDF